MNKKKIAIGLIALMVISVVFLSGCNSWELPGAKAKARDLASDITQAKVEIAELQAEAQAAIDAANADPTTENADAAIGAVKALEDKATATAEKMIDLESLLGAIKESEADVEATTTQAREVAAFLPSPWREAVLIAMTFGLTLVRGNRNAKVLAEKTDDKLYEDCVEARRGGYEDAEKIGLSIVKSLDGKLSDAQLATIKQGPQAKALVDKAQGKA